MTADESIANKLTLSEFTRRSLIVTACALAVILLAWFSWTTAHAALLIFSAFLVAVGLNGLARLIQCVLPISRHGAVAVVATVLALFLGLSITAVTMNIANQAPELKQQVAQSIDQLQSRLDDYEMTQTFLSSSVVGESGEGESDQSIGQRLTGELSGAVSVTMSTLTDFFVIVIIGLYLALQPSLYRDGLLRLFPPSQRKRAWDISEEAADAVRRWLTGRVVSMTVTGIASAAGLALIGIPFAFLLGLLAGLFTFIPYLGALVSAVPALLVAGLHGYWPMVYVAALYVALHTLEGYVLAPMIQKRAVSIAPGFLLSVQVIGGAIAGVLGVALATPIALVIAVIVQLAYVRDVIGDEPHLPGAAHDTD